MRPWRLQFGMRTLLLAMLVLGVSPWLVVRYLEWREDQVWNAFHTAVHERDEAIHEWRRAYVVFIEDIQDETDAARAAEAEARNRYFTARQGVDDALATVRAFYDESSKEIERAIEIRNGKRAIPERAAGSPSARSTQPVLATSPPPS